MRALVGGICVNTGCTPTKALIASAYAAHMARRAGGYGIVIGGGVSADMKRGKARKDTIVEQSRRSLKASPEQTKHCTFLKGHARFLSPHEVGVGSSVIDLPQGRAGMTEAEARQSGWRVLIGQRPMTRVALAVEQGEKQGFMKVLVDGDTKEILHASILGPGGDEVIHCVLDLILAKAPYTVLQRAMHIHPTESELLPAILGALQPL